MSDKVSAHCETTKNRADGTVGALCGSEFVTQKFITWMKKQAGNFAAKCEELGLSEVACIRRAAHEFESIKRDFADPDVEDEYVKIRGNTGARWDLKLTR